MEDAGWLFGLLGCLLALGAWKTASRALRLAEALRAELALREVPPSMPDVPAVGSAYPVAPPPLPPKPPAGAAPPSPRRDWETLLTQRWGLWLGSAALLLAGVFLVRTAAENGWLGPGPRCALAALLGIALIAGAWAVRWRDMAVAAPGLASGGVAVLFAAAYGAGPLYGLVPSGAGFGLLAAVGLTGLVLSLAFGPLVAAVGLAGSFATPLLVATDDPSLPGLFAYLLMVSAAAWAVVRRTAWTWLGWSAAAAAAAWVLVAPDANADLWAPGLFVPAATALTLFLLPGAALDHPVGRVFAWAPMLLLGLAGLVLAAESGDPAVRTGLLLLCPVAMAKAWAEPRLAWLPLLPALLAVFALLAWPLPDWHPTAETITVEGIVQAVLPGSWAPEAIRSLLWTAALVAAFHAAAGLVGERRATEPLPWAGLVAAVPVLALVATYAQVGRFQPRPAWALAAGVLALALAGTAGLARPASRPRAGIHAAGAVAALALGFAVLLDEAWLTVALALMLPALAWIERAAGLPPLRRVAFVVAGAVLIRLVLNPWVAWYDLGTTPVFNGLLIAYGIPAACFVVSAVLFARDGTGRLVPLLETGACLFAALLLVGEIDHAAQGGRLFAAEPGFAEGAWQVTALAAFAAVLQALADRLHRRVLQVACRVALAAALGGEAVLVVFNPMVIGGIGPAAFFNALWPAYAFPAILFAFMLARGARPRKLIGAVALLAGLVGSTAAVRQAFHPNMTAFWTTDFEDAELWAISGVWAVLAGLLLAAGLALQVRALRLAGLLLVALVVLKVFGIDMAGLDGLWRVLSFLGLGLGLIGLGAAYRRFEARV